MEIITDIKLSSVRRAIYATTLLVMLNSIISHIVLHVNNKASSKSRFPSMDEFTNTNSSKMKTSSSSSNNNKKIIQDTFVSVPKKKRHLSDSENLKKWNDVKRGEQKEIANANSHRKNRLSLPTPVLIVGMPKSGTTTIYNYFNCSGIPTSHYCCGGHQTGYPCDKGRPRGPQNKFLTCGRCIKRNLGRGVPPLEGCGIDRFDVFAQMDSEGHNKSGMIMPQVMALEEIHAAYPQATFILNLRDPDRWANSVTNWFGMKVQFMWLDAPQYDFPRATADKGLTTEELRSFYIKHSQHIRNFVKKYPSHTLVEVEIESENAGKVLAESFGLNEECWGHKNKAIDSENLKKYVAEAPARLKKRKEMKQKRDRLLKKNAKGHTEAKKRHKVH